MTNRQPHFQLHGNTFRYFIGSNKWFICIILSLCSHRLSAQNFPVSGNVQLKIPSPFLSDYSAPDNTDLQITLLYSDINNPVEDVRLRIRIEGSGVSVVTKPNAPISPITLTSGLPSVLTGADLVPYLATENLIFQGYSATQYRSRAALPDGFYSICVDVYSAQTNNLLSQGICTQAFLSALEPPILNSPAPCGIKLTPTDPLNIVFSWTPMHSSPAAIEYVFELFWVPAGRNPNDIALNSTPWFTTTTFATAYQYGFSDLPLQVGETYAWRVQARDVQGRSLFVRNGISPVCHFVYGEKCISPLNPQATVEGPQRVVLTWDNEIVVTGSTVEYREYEGTDPKWYPVQTNTNRLVLTNVKAATKYEWRVYNRCGTEAGTPTPIDTFRTRPAFTNNKLSCNQNPNLPPVDSTHKLPQLRAGDKVKIADFVVTIVSATGSNGRFSGVCTVPVNLLNTSVNGTFTNLGINSEYEAYSGEVVLHSATVSYLPPAVRTKVEGYIININTAIDVMNGGLGTAQNGVNTGTAILGEINHIINTEGLPEHVKNELEEVKKTVQNGINAMQNGDTTEGKSILSGAGGMIDNVLNGGGIVGEFGDIIKKVFKDVRDSTSKIFTSPKSVFTTAQAEASEGKEGIDTKESDVEIGVYESSDFDASESMDGIERIPLNTEEEKLIDADPYHQKLKRSANSIHNTLRTLDKAVFTIAYLDINSLPDKFPIISKQIVESFKSDLSKFVTMKITEIPTGKKLELENSIKLFLKTEIDKLYTESINDER